MNLLMEEVPFGTFSFESFQNFLHCRFQIIISLLNNNLI